MWKDHEAYYPFLFTAKDVPYLLPCSQLSYISVETS